MYKELVENLSYGIVLLDDSMRVQYANKYIEDILKTGCSGNDYKGQVCGNAFLCINALWNDTECGEAEECRMCELRQKLLQIRDEKAIKNNESKIFRILKVDGEIIRFRLKGYRMDIEGKNHLVIEIKNAEKEENLIKISEKMNIWNKKLERILDKLQDQVCVLDENLNYIYVNNSLCNAVGKRREDIIGKNDYELVTAEMAKICQKNNLYALENGDFSNEEYVEGQWYHTLKGRVEVSKGKYGIFGIIKNITEEKKKERSYERKIYIDSLTGLHNRNFYEERAEDIFLEAQRDEDDFTMLILDVDNFKDVNDIHGHHFGDNVLQELSKVIKKNIRKKDYAVRFGGDEMVLLLNATSEIAGQIGKRIIQEINSMEIEGITTSISIGVATRIEEKFELKDLYICADKALYESKKRLTQKP